MVMVDNQSRDLLIQKNVVDLSNMLIICTTSSAAAIGTSLFCFQRNRISVFRSGGYVNWSLLAPLPLKSVIFVLRT